MAAPSGINQSLTDLTDVELREVVLSDWLQLTSVLAHELPVRLLSRLLRIELERGAGARLTFVERLRGALSRARSRESSDAQPRIVFALIEDAVPAWSDLAILGLEEHDIQKLQAALEQAGFSRL